MSSSASSAASPSPPASPAIGYREPPGLSRLIQHFIAAKRALTSTQHIERVSYVVSDTRQLIEKTTVQTAKNAFAKGRVNEQLGILHTIHSNITASGAVVDDEFSAVVSKLDAAHARLQTTLDSLKKVVVDASLQHNDAVEEESKTLFDFVDESQYKDIFTSLKIYIDTYQAAKTDLQSSLDHFADHMQHIASFLESPVRPDSPTIKPSIYDEPILPAAEAFAAMEEHAGEMATALQSLIKHYDLCTTALKHTEGGREAAKTAVMSKSNDLRASNLDESLFSMKIEEPISSEERAEMLEVLENDAYEVEEVVNEIRDRGSNLEILHEQFESRFTIAETTRKDIRQAVSLLKEVRIALPDHLAAIKSFQDMWLDVNTSISSQLSDIVNLQAFYEEFQSGYKKLLREVDRRKAVEMQMRRLATKAQKELDSLYKADKLARDEFVGDVASFLPSDLWPGVVEAGVRWTVEIAAPSIESDHPEMSLENDAIGKSS